MNLWNWSRKRRKTLVVVDVTRREEDGEVVERK